VARNAACLIAVLIAAVLAGGALPGAALAQEAPKAVEVKGLKDPELRRYRSVSVGLDVFDQHRALAPQVDALRFRLVPQRAHAGATTDGVTLHIVGKGEPVAIPIMPDGRFTIARDEAAFRDNADLMFNRKRNMFRSIADVRTPGLPDKVRRLGDFRLECRVNIAIIKTEVPLYIRAAITSLLLTSDWCSKMGIFMSLPPHSQLARATLVHGQRSTDIPLHLLEAGYESPLSDAGWPDDALLELEYAGG
jgi:hypothetical protein